MGDQHLDLSSPLMLAFMPAASLRPHLVDGIDWQVGHWVLVAHHLHVVEDLLPWLHTHPRAKCGVDDLQAVNAVHLAPHHLWQACQLVLSRGRSKREARVRQAHGDYEELS